MPAISYRPPLHSTGRFGRDLAESDGQQLKTKVVPPRQGTIILPHSAPLTEKTVAFRGIVDGLRARGFLPVPLQLLSPEETNHGDHLLDIDKFAQRIIDAVAGTRGAPVGLFGEKLDGAAILAAAATGDLAAHALVLPDKSDRLHEGAGGYRPYHQSSRSRHAASRSPRRASL